MACDNCKDDLRVYCPVCHVDQLIATVVCEVCGDPTCPCGKVVLRTDAELIDALRACRWILSQRAISAESEIVRLNGTVEHLRAFCLNPHEHEHGVCEACNGIGSRMYSNTSTWREGCGGSAMTTGVCNKCWGSGSEELPWKSWRAIDAEWRTADRLSQENEALRSEIARLAESGTGYSQQTVDAIVKERDQLRVLLGFLKQIAQTARKGVL